MSDLDERLSRLISNDDSMKQVIELASAVISGQNSRSSTGSDKKEPPTADPDLASVLQSLTGTPQQDTRSTEDATTSSLLGLMPQLLQALSGDTSMLQNDRVNLVRAIQPYLPQTQAGNIERAVRMATLTKVAKDALKLLGR